MPGTPSSAASSRLERQHRDLRRAVDSHRHVDRPHAAAHEHRRAARRRPMPATTGNFCAAMRARRPAARPGRRACGLTARAARSSAAASVSRRGIVREQDRHRRGAAHQRARCRPAASSRSGCRRGRSSRRVDRQTRVRASFSTWTPFCRERQPACRGRRRDCRGWRRRRAAPTSGASASADGAT